MGKFTATHVTIVIVVFLTAIVVLSVTGHDSAALISVGVAILAGLGLSLGQQQAVKEQTNGNTSRLMQMISDSAKAQTEQAKTTASLLALMTPGSALAEAKVIEMAASVIQPPPLEIPTERDEEKS